MKEDIIHSDISKAQTLPSKYYTDEGTFLDIISGFSKFWHFAAHEGQLLDNNVIPLEHMEELVGEAILLAKNEEILALSNVCTHRGMLVSTEPCNISTLKCRYHGRTFGLDGKFKNMPEFKDVKDFPTARDNLLKFPLRIWKGIIFTGVNPTYFESVFDTLEKRLGWMPIDSFQYDLSRFRSYEINANWALYVDNYLEGFHIPFVHGDLNQELDYDSYRTELFEGGVLQVGVAKNEEECFNLPDSSPDYGEQIAAYYYWIYPGLMLNFYPWGLSVNLVIPLSVNRTKIIYHGFVWNKEKLGRGAGGDLDKVESEDQEIVEATQRGVNSAAYDRGRYSPTKETGIHHFHKILTSNTGI